jgi:hypothetical protein
MAMACGMAAVAPTLAKSVEAIPPKIKKQTLVEQKKLDSFYTRNVYCASGYAVTGQYSFSGTYLPMVSGLL